MRRRLLPFTAAVTHPARRVRVRCRARTRGRGGTHRAGGGAGGAGRAGAGQVVVAGLPDGEHALKNIAVVGGALYVLSIGSSCNLCASDTTSTPQRAAIYRYPRTGGTGTLVVTKGTAGGGRGAAGRRGRRRRWVPPRHRRPVRHGLPPRSPALTPGRRSGTPGAAIRRAVRGRRCGRRRARG